MGGKRVALDFDDDLVNQRSQQFLSVPRRRRCCSPNRDKIGSERKDAVALLLVDRSGACSFTTRKIGFGGLHRLQAFFPLAFEPTRNETVVRVDGSIAAFGALGFVAGALDSQSPLPEDRLAIGLKPFGGGKRRSQFCRRQSGQEKARTIVAKIAPAYARDKEVEFCSAEMKRPGVPVKHLFLEGRATTTVLLWICFLIGYYLIFLLLSWAPTLLHKSGASVQQYSISFGLINFGSAIATVTVGWLMDKFRNHPHLILQVGFLIGFLSLAAFGYFSTSPFIVIASLSVMNGLFICGTVSGLVALVTLSYPNDITGSAVGWAFAIGRGGATLAPMVGGIFIGLNWTVFRICGVNAIGALVIIGLIGLVAADSARMRKAASNAC